MAEVGAGNGSQRSISSVPVTGNAAHGESPKCLEAAFPTPRVDRGPFVGRECRQECTTSQ